LSGKIKFAGVLLLVGLCAAPIAQGQTRKKGPAKPAQKAAAPREAGAQYKGIWELVSYNADVKLFDVFFTTAEEGWVSGGKDEVRGGIILHTRDGGSHWDVQYGDPESSDRAVIDLRFLDRTHGWGVQRTGQASRLLHTTDGKNWILSGTIAEHTKDYMFTSEQNGVGVGGDQINRTTDGGRTWKPMARCQANVQVQGLERNVRCEWVRIRFITPSLGYALGFSRDEGVRNTIFLSKTTDGGATWTMNTGQATEYTQDGFFIDENTGYVRVGAADTGQIFKTTDGGKTWTGMAASPGRRILFADPEVGWSFHYNKVSFTTDGGSHWNSRQYPFPATVLNFSLPRRDRGYIVGDHGMIYRYRMVPFNYSSAGMIAAPLLSGINSPLDKQAEKLFEQVRVLARAAGVPPPLPGGDAEDEDEDEDKVKAPPASGGFEQEVNQTEATFAQVSSEAPGFISKYRNLNLLVTGAVMVQQIPDEISELKQSLASLKGIKNPKDAAATLAGVQSQASDLKQAVRTAFQKK